MVDKVPISAIGPLLRSLRRLPRRPVSQPGSGRLRARIYLEVLTQGPNGPLDLMISIGWHLADDSCPLKSPSSQVFLEGQAALASWGSLHVPDARTERGIFRGLPAWRWNQDIPLHLPESSANPRKRIFSMRGV